MPHTDTEDRLVEQPTRSLINGLLRENCLETDGPQIRRVLP